MTVEELNIKISADADSFKNAVAEANSAMQKFREDAIAAGNDVTKAFNDMLAVQLEISVNDSPANNAAAVTAADSNNGSNANEPLFSRLARAANTIKAANDADDVQKPSISGFMSFMNAKNNTSQGTVNVLSLNENETLIGAVSGNDNNNASPVNITTTVELDGEKVGQSVDRFFLRRNKMTNGKGG